MPLRARHPLGHEIPRAAVFARGELDHPARPGGVQSVPELPVRVSAEVLPDEEALAPREVVRAEAVVEAQQGGEAGEGVAGHGKWGWNVGMDMWNGGVKR